MVWDLAFDSLIWSNNFHSSSEISSGLVEKDLEAMDLVEKVGFRLRARAMEDRNCRERIA